MRNLKKEAEWSKKRYKQLTYRCPKETAEQLDEKLKADKLKFSDWLKERIERYLKPSEWTPNEPSIWHKCSNCNENGFIHYEYCPWCGSFMKNNTTTIKPSE